MISSSENDFQKEAKKPAIDHVFRSGVKTSDQVQGQGAGRSRKSLFPAYVQYVSIYRRPATQPLSLRWGFETISKQMRR